MSISCQWIIKQSSTEVYLYHHILCYQSSHHKRSLCFWTEGFQAAASVSCNTRNGVLLSAYSTFFLSLKGTVQRNNSCAQGRCDRNCVMALHHTNTVVVAAVFVVYIQYTCVRERGCTLRYFMDVCMKILTGRETVGVKCTSIAVWPGLQLRPAALREGKKCVQRPVLWSKFTLTTAIALSSHMRLVINSISQLRISQCIH